jgi:hypothetical protein
MSAHRRKQLKERKEKQSRQDAGRRAMFDRVVKALGLSSLFDHLPTSIVDNFLKKIRPSIEVVIDDESKNNQKTQEVAEALTLLVRQPIEGEIDGRRFILSLDELVRCYFTIVSGIAFYFQDVKPQTDTDSDRRFTMLSEAKDKLKSLEGEWLPRLLDTLISAIADVTERDYRVDLPIVETRLCLWVEPRLKCPPQLRLRYYESLTRKVKYIDARSLAYFCRSSDFVHGLRTVTWNCKTLGIEGPNCDQPVLIHQHAIDRLHERLPVPGSESVLHKGMVEALNRPVLIPNEPNSYLVEFRLSEDLLGYFVAEIHPAFILIITFLFLTMRGTPESTLLREKLGLYGADVEHYMLDDFFTLVGSDIADDPLLRRVLSECGCGHLLSVLDAELRLPWLQTFGEKFKKTFNVREAQRGFLAGEKWNRWSH